MNVLIVQINLLGFAMEDYFEWVVSGNHFYPTKNNGIDGPIPKSKTFISSCKATSAYYVYNIGHGYYKNERKHRAGKLFAHIKLNTVYPPFP